MDKRESLRRLKREEIQLFKNNLLFNELKICGRCKVTKNNKFFGVNKSTVSGFSSYCKDCINNLSKSVRLENKKNPDKVAKKLQYQKKYRDANKGKFIEKDRIRENKRMKNDNGFKLKKYLRNKLTKAIKRNSLNSSINILLGCSLYELKQYLSLSFKENMNWSNYGEWHIDHIIPCCYFDLTILENQKKCFHYTNLQPLWAEENIKKGSRIILNTRCDELSKKHLKLSV